MFSCSRVCTLFFVARLACAQGPPVTMHTMWSLDRTYNDHVHGVTFRYPGTWTLNNSAASYHAPALLESADIPTPIELSFAEGSFPRTQKHRPYSRTTLEVVDIYAAKLIRDVSACNQLASTIADALDSTKRIVAGTPFYVRRTGKSGMSQFIEGRLYSTFMNQTCFLFETDAAGLADGVELKAHTLSSHEYAIINARLFSIVRTIRITPGADHLPRP